MATSPQMQAKIDKINKLIEEGYILQKTNQGFIEFRNASGKPVNIYGLLKSPAGFSWIAFFFPFAVCAQIKEWSYFYINGIAFAIIALIHRTTGINGNNAAGFAIAITYGYMFPYLRKIAQDSGVEDASKSKSILIGILLSIVCLTPSYLIDIVFGNF